MIKIEPVYENDNSILIHQVHTLEMKPTALAVGASGITLRDDYRHRRASGPTAVLLG